MANEPEEIVLVCMVATRMDCYGEGTVFGHHCSGCGAEVMIARSGQRALRDMPGIRIICDTCAVPIIPIASRCVPAPGAMEELREHHRNERLKRRRN